MALLIGFDKNRENVELKGHCKLSINFISHYLYVEPVNEEFKLISASFKWTYIMKKNLLFVFAEFDFLDFCLAFKNEQICKKIFDYIASGKKDVTGINKEASIDTSFLIPIFKKIASNPTFHTSLIEVIAKWVQFLDQQDKKKYTNMMKEYGIFDDFCQTKLNQMESGKKQYVGIKIETKDLDEDALTKLYPKVIPSSLYQLMYSSRPQQQPRSLLIFTSDKREAFHQYKAKSEKFKCVKCDYSAILDNDEHDEICVKVKNKKHSCKPFTKIPADYQKILIIRKPNYELFENCGGKIKSALVIFDSVDKNLCHDYFWNKRKFYCSECRKKGLNSYANLFYKDTSKEYVEIINHQNRNCPKRKFQLQRYQPIYDYVLKPNFEIQKYYMKGKEKNKLIVLDENDRKKCYQYYFIPKENRYGCLECLMQKKYVTAKLRQNFERQEYVILSNAKHLCQPKPYVSKPIIYLHQPEDFESIIDGKHGVSRVFVFLKNDKTKCYMFNWDQGIYYCSGCKSMTEQMRKRKDQNRFGKICIGYLSKNTENNQFSFQHNANQIHICEPKDYQPEIYQSLPKTYDFFYYRQPKKAPIYLAIRSAENENLCHKFVYDKCRNAFCCMQCKRLKKYLRFKPQKDANGKEYFDHETKMHVCKPTNISSIPKSDIIEKNGLNFDPKPRKRMPADKDKTFRMPNFELRPNKFGVPHKKLIVFHPTDKTLCYHYYSVDQKKYQGFKCNGCNRLRSNANATLLKDEKTNEAYVVMGKKEHVCQPLKYIPL